MTKDQSRRATAAAVCTIEGLEARRLLSVSLVKDVAPLPNGTFDGDSQPLVPLDGRVYFDLDSALWKSGGTATGTVIVKDFAPLVPSPAVAVGNTLFFAVEDGQGDFELWKSDGTTDGTVKVAPLPPIDAIRGYGNLTASGNLLYFTQPPDVSNVNGPGTLWRSDGTAAGTYSIAPLPPSNQGNYTFGTLNGSLFFANTDDAHGSEPWVTDGTAAGTRFLSDINPGVAWSSPSQFATLGKQVYFSASAAEQSGLWMTDGTSAGTTLVYNPKDTILSIAAVGNAVFFAVAPDYNAGTPAALYRTDGTATGTTLLQAIPPTSIPTFTITDVNGTAFVTENLSHELWKRNGTAAGTVMVKSFAGAISDPVDLNGVLVFAADDGSHGPELWKSDGTAAGTVLLKDIYPGAVGSEPSELSVSGGKLFFKATDPSTGRELWTSDGTSGGTKLVADLTGGTEDFDLHHELNVGNLLYFTGSTMGQIDDALYRTDGTAAGTFALASGSVGPMTDADGTVYFTLDPLPAGSPSLWKTDGTVAGTTMVAAGSVGELTSIGGTAFYTINSQLWKTDGTAAGTVMLPVTGNLNDIVSAPRGPLYFVTSQRLETPPYSLWVSDGTPAGTSQLITFSGQLGQLLPVGNRLYFEADDGSHAGLWTSDGTLAGTIFLSPVPPGFAIGEPPEAAVLNGRLLYFANAGNSDTFLWSTDGTPTGTAALADIMADGTALLPQSLTVVGNYAYFTATNVPTGAVALWRTDGTPRGTSPLLANIGATVTGDSPTLAAFDGNLYFPANLDPSIGTELYVADAGGIALAADIVPGATGSYPDKLVSTGNVLLFTADDAIHGREFWNYSLPTNSISGRVYNDANHDAFQQPGEQGINGVTVFLDINNDGKLETGEPSAKTDANGTYAFSNVTPGIYSVRVIDPTGYRRTAPLLTAAKATSGLTPQPTGPVFGEVAVASVPLDFSYLLALAQHYNGPGTFAQGDLNGDDKVDFSDLLILAQHYGHSLPQLPFAGSGNA